MLRLVMVVMKNNTSILHDLGIVTLLADELICDPAILNTICVTLHDVNFDNYFRMVPGLN